MSTNPGLPKRTWNREQLQKDLMARVIIDSVTGCWIWQRSKTSGGYGRIRVSCVYYLAHKVALYAFKGIWTSGRKVYVCHSCDNPPCINPDHVSKRTPGWNAQDSISKGRRKIKAKCLYGHDRVLVGKYITCRICDRLRHRKKAA